MSVQNCLTKDLFQLKNRHISDVAEIYMIVDRGPNKTLKKTVYFDGLVLTTHESHKN